MDKLLKMLDAEVAMEKTYASLFAAERQAYVEANPHSRFAERAMAKPVKKMPAKPQGLAALNLSNKHHQWLGDVADRAAKLEKIHPKNLAARLEKFRQYVQAGPPAAKEPSAIDPKHRKLAKEHLQNTVHARLKDMLGEDDPEQINMLAGDAHDHHKIAAMVHRGQDVPAADFHRLLDTESRDDMKDDLYRHLHEEDDD
jgi:hypothetical protein